MNAPAAASAAEVLPRARLRVLWQSALVLWLPTLVPLLTGMLRECSHCAVTYTAITPIVPGVLAPVACGAQGAWFFVVGAVATLALLGLLYVGGREFPRALLLVLRGIVALVVVGQAVGLAHAVRA